MRYLNYAIEDFLADESFQQYCSGTDKAAVDYWAKVLTEQPEMEGTFEEAVQCFALLNGGQGNVEEQTARLLQRVNAAEEVTVSGAERRTLYKTWWAAAAVLLILATVGFFLLKPDSKTETALAGRKEIRPQKDIAPGGDRAVLTLSDGRRVVLDTTANGALSQQGATKISKTGGRLTYTAEENSIQVLYNTVATPKGGQYQLVLADGTKVWLNAASSLRFPTAFTGMERKVELTGEGYFEVAHNADRPFFVSVNDVQVKVLGTHFNINGYADETAVKTTLLEGRVMVNKGTKTVFLNPGQQAQVSDNEAIRVQAGVDLDEVVAWKNGHFQFNSADVKTVMRQIERWYDVEAGFSGNLQAAHISGEMPRTFNLSQVIKVLELSGIEIQVDGKKLLITPKP